jgi:hypothetical protein
MKSKTTSTTQSIRILKTATCPSLSGKSKLTYNVGVDSNNEIHIRVHTNSSSGFFSREWMAISAIQQVLSKVSDDKPLTSFLLHTLYAGKSQNNSGFLWALLKAEGLVQLHEDKQRSYALMDSKKFLAEMKALIASGVDLKIDEPAKRGAKVTSAAVAKKGKPAKADAMSVVEIPVDVPAVQPIEVKPKRAASSKGKGSKAETQSALGL